MENLDTTELTDDQQAYIGAPPQDRFCLSVFPSGIRLTAAENVELPMILADVDLVLEISRPGGPYFPRPQRPRRTSAGPVIPGTASTRCHCQGYHYAAGGRSQRMSPPVIWTGLPGIEVIRILEDLNHKGITLIMVTHDPDLSRRAARRVQLADGKIATDTGGSMKK